jgi:Lon protease-like protein
LEGIAYNRTTATHRQRNAVTTLIPLFPLDVVLFPGAALPLHIFEPRYKEMIGECLADKSVFGVLRTGEKNIAEIGCTAEIIAVARKYPDGRLDIVTEGRHRFEVLQLNQERSFLRGKILLLEDERGDPTTEDSDRAIQLHTEILALAGSAPDLSSSGLTSADSPALSFRLAGSLPLDLDFKQQLLELRSENRRISALIEYLEIILPKLRSVTHARKRAGGNGHAR